LEYSDVGKTSFVSRFIHPEKAVDNHQVATVGVEFVSKEIELAQSRVTLQLFDT